MHRQLRSFPTRRSSDLARLELLIKDLTRPNGIAFSPDEKYLYIAVSDPDHKVWMRYDVQKDGHRSASRLCDRRSEEHTSELQSLRQLVCRLLLEKKRG